MEHTTSLDVVYEHYFSSYKQVTNPLKTVQNITIMKTRTIIFLFASVILTACFEFGIDKIKGQAYIVDNFKDKNPLEGIYVEVVYSKDEGHAPSYLTSSVTDINGYFEIDTEFRAGFFNLDSWSVANVYSDPNYSDTLGSFNFQFPDNTYDYRTIHLDTLTLSHHIWVIPRIKSLRNKQPDEISIYFYNCELVDTSFTRMTFSGPVDLNQQFTPVEIIMSMRTQHWLSYGTRELAIGSLKKNSEDIGFGYFKLEGLKHTIEGDTLYLDFNI